MVYYAKDIFLNTIPAKSPDRSELPVGLQVPLFDWYETLQSKDSIRCPEATRPARHGINKKHYSRYGRIVQIQTVHKCNWYTIPSTDRQPQYTWDSGGT